MDENLKKKVDTIIGFGRLGGGVLAIVGSIIFYFMLQAALDPNATISINGVSTNDSSAKISVVLFCALFPLAGLFIAIVPDKYLDKWVTALVKLIG